MDLICTEFVWHVAEDQRYISVSRYDALDWMEEVRYQLQLRAIPYEQVSP